MSKSNDYCLENQLDEVSYILLIPSEFIKGNRCNVYIRLNADQGELVCFNKRFSVIVITF